MGNYFSCTFVFPLMKNTKPARVIFPTGEVKQFKEIVKAAELMLEYPNYFLANSRSLHIGRRFCALGADEVLQFENVYIFYPMRRLNSFVTAADVTVFLLAANSAAKRITATNARIGPKESEVVEESLQENNNTLSLSFEGVGEGFRNRVSYCRSRKPMLETINEESIRSR